MATPPTNRVHPTALVSPEADLADDVQVGAYAVLEGPVRLGPGCVVRPTAQLIGPLTMGRGNDVGRGTVLGERPQHLRDPGESSELIVGDGNIFRENVTVHRGTSATGRTVLGSHNFLMTGAHVAHDCVIGSHCILANNALVGGHCTVGERVFLSGNSAVHQFMRVGRLALLSGISATSHDLPPFMILQGINNIVGVNVVGMRRAGLTGEQITAVRTAYRILFLQGKPVPVAVAQIERELGAVDVVAELVGFIRQSTHGICAARDRRAA
jgi:UDP-N-acetylglucosamine acyltransferase